ncbi:hypothetical protein DFH07DRAFT_918528 [Mycena maculata]|uniref:NodB homology domain-containing protein n=1 Tax=Mycena maculata TaxID=230809 RepID=A0AAD7JAV0_9AGAR|nr:hypothetical protein DFH07DRAFT_918528 [Mycena maculata]
MAPQLLMSILSVLTRARSRSHLTTARTCICNKSATCSQSTMGTVLSSSMAKTVKFTFCLLHRNSNVSAGDCIYGTLQMSNLTYAYKAGHQIANHGWSHMDLTTCANASQCSSSLFRQETPHDSALGNIIGAKPSYLRPPYGSYNSTVQQMAAAHGMDMVLWDLDSGDSTGSSVNQSEAIYDNALNGGTDGTLLALNHETSLSTVQQVMPYVLPQWIAQGWTFVTVAQCFNNSAINPNVKPAYSSITTPGTRNFTWHC